jgi:hypothetical protein
LCSTASRRLDASASFRAWSAECDDDAFSLPETTRAHASFVVPDEVPRAEDPGGGRAASRSAASRSAARDATRSAPSADLGASILARAETIPPRRTT